MSERLVFFVKKEILEFAMEKSLELMAAPTCSAEARAAAQAWLDAAGTPGEAEATRRYLAELEADIVTAQGLLVFAESEAGAKVFGADKAPGVAAHARELIAAGAKYCDCPACAAVEAILARKEELLA